MQKRSPRKKIIISPEAHERLVKIAKENHRTLRAQVEFWIGK